MTRVKARSLETECDGFLQAAHQRFQISGGHVDGFMDRTFSPFIQVLYDDGEPIPSYVYVGPRGLMTRFYGQSAVDGAPGTRGLPDRKFGRSCAGRYAEVRWTRAPALDRVSGKTQGLWVEYDRLILPCTLGGRMPTFVVFLHLQRTLRAQDASCARDLRARSTTANSWANS